MQEHPRDSTPELQCPERQKKRGKEMLGSKTLPQIKLQSFRMLEHEWDTSLKSLV
jgi:hypothetical protein